jgi:hypothetical protein
MFSRENSLAGLIRDQMHEFGFKPAPGRPLPWQGIAAAILGVTARTLNQFLPSYAQED